MTVVALIAVGLAAGTLAAALGVGGGVVFVPALVVILGFGQQLAEGTSLAVILPTAIVGTWVHHRRGRIDWPAATAIGLSGVLGALLGSRIALDLHPLLLRRLFAGMLLLVAWQLIVRIRARSG